MNSFKILGLLLTYPEGTVLGAGQDLLALLREEGMLHTKGIKKIQMFLDEQNAKDLLVLQEEYVFTFDRQKLHSLHLFEHIHGESRERGQAMVNLGETYASKGLYIDNGELPDYLPLFMEYLSKCPIKEASALLGEAIDVIATIGARLAKKESSYAHIFAAIEQLSAINPDKVKVKEALASRARDPQTLEQLDEQWAEAEAFAKPTVDDCGQCSHSTSVTGGVQ